MRAARRRRVVLDVHFLLSNLAGAASKSDVSGIRWDPTTALTISRLATEPGSKVTVPSGED